MLIPISDLNKKNQGFPYENLKTFFLRNVVSTKDVFIKFFSHLFLKLNFYFKD